MAFGDRIRQLRKKSGKSLRRVARESGLSASFLSMLELGKTIPTHRAIESLAPVIGVSEDVLYIEAGLMPPRMQKLVMERPRLIFPLLRRMEFMGDAELEGFAKAVLGGSSAGDEQGRDTGPVADDVRPGKPADRRIMVR